MFRLDLKILLLTFQRRAYLINLNSHPIQKVLSQSPFGKPIACPIKLNRLLTLSNTAPQAGSEAQKPPQISFSNNHNKPPFYCRFVTRLEINPLPNPNLDSAAFPAFPLC